MSTVYGLSERAAMRLRELLAEAGDTSRAREARRTGDRLRMVECLSATAIGAGSILSQCYPAKILEPRSDYAVPPEEGGLCLLTLLGPGGADAAPVVGAVYLALLAGQVRENAQQSGSSILGGRRRAFAVAPAPVESATPLNGDPATQLTQYAVPSSEVTASSPYYQSVVGNDVGSSLPGVIQYTAPAGSGTTPALTVTTTAAQQTVSYTLNSQTGGYTVTESAGDVVFTYATGTKIDFTNATVTGLSTGARTEGTLTATGSVQGDAAAITVDAVKVSGADNTKGVILPNTAAALIYLWNDDADILNVYPNSGAAIGAGATDAAQSVAGGAKWVFYRFTSTQWYSVAVL